MAINLSRLFTSLGRDVGSLNLLTARKGGDYSTAVSALQAHASAEVIAAVSDDQPLANLDTDSALAQVAYALTAATETVKYKHGTITVAGVGSPTGTPKFVTTDLTPFGTQSNFLLGEVITLRATDSASLSLISQAAVDKLDPTWPKGSGINGPLELVDTTTNFGVLSNGSFATWSGTPLAADSWEIASPSDVWGTDFTRVSDEPITADGYCLKVLSDGAIKQLKQAVTVTEGAVYALHFFAKKVVYAGGTGTLAFTFRDQNGTQLGSTSVTQTFTGLGTSWTSYGGVLHAPRQIPPTSTVYLEVRWTGTSGDYFYLDNVSLQAMTPLYTGGPSIIGFRGVTDLVLDTDAWTVTVAVSSPTSSLVVGIDRLLGLAGKGFEFPWDATGTYNDSLVV